MYIELHARSAFSFLEGASVPEALAAVCAALEMPAMALLDRDGVYGAPRFHLAAKKAGLRAHIGAEASCQWPVAIQDRVIGSSGHRVINGEPQIGNQKSEIGNEVSGFRFPVSGKASPSKSQITNYKSQITNGPLCRLPLLVASRTGYQNLCRLVTRMKMRVPKNTACATAETELKEFSGGLVCLTGGDDGPLAAALARGGIEEGRRTLERLVEIFGRDNVYVELQRHFQREEEARNQAAIAIARALRLPLIATNGVQYATAREREVLDVLTCIREHKRLENAGRLLARNSERHLKSAAQMSGLFADLPQAIAATEELSARLQFTLADLGYEFPRYPVPEGESMNSFLRKRTGEGFEERYGRASADLRKRAKRQVERELALIEKLELAGYFLIVWDIVRFCREQRILVQGRGSAANSAVCYSLGITAVDPVGMDLLFERFLSEERGEWPDIDLDLPSGDQRERAIQYVYERYGKLGAAMTANVITYRGRLAAREMGKAMGFDAETLNRLAAMVGSWEYKSPDDTLERHFRDAGFDLRHPRLRKYLELCLAVQDLPRHLGQHSGGMVICQGQLDSVVPLEPASMPGRVVVQWDKEDCADMGIIKVDLLGLGMMAVLEDCLQLIPQHYGEQVDLAHLPANDPAVYGALQKADTVGMFQIESRAQMSCLPRLRPQCFYDIVIQVALIRPGPIVGEMVNPYIKRRQGREAVAYAHPALEPILERTLGVPLFQEQLLRIAMVAANFTGGEAEELRRALGAKRSEKRMKEIEVKLRRGMEQNGIAPAAQEQIIQSIVSFALYGFPESHAASFALIAYASAYLKCHYLAAFTAALLNNWPMGFYHPSTVVKDAQRHGLKMKPIDVLRSDWLCALEVSGFQFPVSGENTHLIRNRKSEIGNDPMTRWPDDPIVETGNSLAVRLGLRYVKGLREDAARAIVERRKLRPFASIDELVRRVPELRKNELQALAEIGALNALGGSPQRHRGTEKISDFRFPISDWREASRALQSEIRNQKSEITRLPDYPITRFHRRDALWQVERAVRRPGPLLEEIHEADTASPLARMTPEERLVADFRGTGLTVGPHPMSYRRDEMNARGVVRAMDLPLLPNGKYVRIAGTVIARQRPGTAHGFVFLSLEDESGIANAIITPDLFEQNRLLLVSEQFLYIEGTLQNIDNVISVKAKRVSSLCPPSAGTVDVTDADTPSHDFH
jgi:error-prone DNA polymerase